jgi:Rod binding domain-containing protein
LAPDRTAKLRELSQELEATFLTEMLKHAGLGEARDGFGGGIGEEQFSSMLLQEHAKQITANGGIGLAENLFQALVKREES